MTNHGRQGHWPGFTGAISDHGGSVVLATASRLVPADTNRTVDVYVADRRSRTIHRISLSDDGKPGNDLSGESVAVSGGGRFVAFSSMASNLVDGDTNRTSDVFVRDRVTGTTRARVHHQ